ncbi:hypothetical protein [Lyngbya aestuarii]|uniref:hypothetical protein n=1 Tax=Lyngbya aestuarii TaxID=118322 RepID=UPI00403DA16E
MGDITKEDVRERLGNIEKIRDLLFGAKLREYDNRLAEIESHLSTLQQGIRNQVEQLKASLSKEVGTVVDSLDKKLKSLKGNSQEESAEIHQQLEQLNKKLAHSVGLIDEIIYQQATSLKEELAETSKELNQNVVSLREQIYQDLEKRFKTINQTKVSRDDTAEIILEIALRIKGTELVSELKKAANPGSQENFSLIKHSQKL